MMKDNSAADNNVLTKKDEFDGFKPMPKRFMVWDTKHEDWRKCKLPGSRHWGYVFELHQLAILLTNASNNGLPRNRFKIVQSTGTFDEDGEEIWEDSMVRDYDGQIGVVYYDAEEGGYWVKAMNGDSWQLADTNLMKVMGHFSSNPNLILETKNGH